MKYYADLHIHSHFSRATSKSSHLFGLAAWAAVKGIQVVGTGDFTHPGWFAHLFECLEPAEPGFFCLKKESGRNYQQFLPPETATPVPPESTRFILSAEVSSIYKRGGKVRKVHNLLYAPDFESVRRINRILATIGNIASDGRPILGLDSRDLLEILLEQAPEGFLVPAHVWTPWFSLFGSKSGFDRIEECFADLSDHIFALETGLSSDPEMNRLVSSLDRFTLISNSDCHSPAKLGREANVFTTDFDYFSLRQALQNPIDTNGKQAFAATIEFYPEEGKYHCDGHRKCGVCLEPAETRNLNGICPQCGKPLTIGVLHRVMELADRHQPLYPSGSPGVHSLIPLQELIAELLGCGPATKKAMHGYARLISTFGSELQLLLDVPVDEITGKGYPLVAEAVERVRSKRVIRKPGYDGAFGVIKVFSEGERAELCGQKNLFGPTVEKQSVKKRTRQAFEPETRRKETLTKAVASKGLNDEQMRAVTSTAARIVVQAGPGTGKTHTLVTRVQRTALHSPLPCTVITFTNKAAGEVRARVQAKPAVDGTKILVATFHGYCLQQLRRTHPQLQVVGPEERAALLEEIFPDETDTGRHELAEVISRTLGQPGCHPIDARVCRYSRLLAERTLIDIDAVVSGTVELLQLGGASATAIRSATGHLFVDEFQDVNQAQYDLIAQLAATSTVFAIGDPDQAIYGFRGSDPQRFQNFIDEFGPEYHQLIVNYRNGATLIKAAEHLIAHNPHPRPQSAMQACNTHTGTLHVQSCNNPDGEASFIADQIELQLGGTSHRGLHRFDHTGADSVSFRDIGVLYRTSRQAEVISAVLTTRGIPFQLVDLDAYYTRGECRYLYYWMLLLAGQATIGHLLFLLGREKGVGKQTLRRVRAILQNSPSTTVLGDDVLSVIINEINSGSTLHGFQALYTEIKAILTDGQSLEALFALLTRYYGLDLQQSEIKRFGQLALTFGDSVTTFATHLQEFSDGVVYDQRAEAVTLSTLHAAKGLEFPVVFIAGVEERLLPLALHSVVVDPLMHGAHLQEERRLLYVGMTRAIVTLYLTWCRRRNHWETNGTTVHSSRFLDELPLSFFSPPPTFRPAPTKGKPFHRQLSLFS